MKRTVLTVAVALAIAGCGGGTASHSSSTTKAAATTPTTTTKKADPKKKKHKPQHKAVHHQATIAQRHFDQRWCGADHHVQPDAGPDPRPVEPRARHAAAGHDDPHDDAPDDHQEHADQHRHHAAGVSEPTPAG